MRSKVLKLWKLDNQDLVDAYKQVEVLKSVNNKEFISKKVLAAEKRYKRWEGTLNDIARRVIETDKVIAKCLLGDDRVVFCEFNLLDDGNLYEIELADDYHAGSTYELKQVG
jgi:hypothetical protein